MRNGFLNSADHARSFPLLKCVSLLLQSVDLREKLFESPRVSRRLNTLRGLSYEQVEQVLARGA